MDESAAVAGGEDPIARQAWPGARYEHAPGSGVPLGLAGCDRYASAGTPASIVGTGTAFVAVARKRHAPGPLALTA
jgi:hypothetical protein